MEDYLCPRKNKSQNAKIKKSFLYTSEKRSFLSLVKYNPRYQYYFQMSVTLFTDYYEIMLIGSKKAAFSSQRLELRAQ